MFLVAKEINFCYGHRLLNYSGKCRNLHGHNGKAEIQIAAAKLDSRGMVRDFTEIKHILHTWIDQNLDHRMLLNKKDRLIPFLKKSGEPLYLLDANPTAENIAKLIYEEAQKKGLPVTAVTLWETPNSNATYTK